MYNFERGHSNRRSKHNAVFSWNCPKLLVQAFVLFRDSFRDWQPKMLQTCTHAMEISTTNMRTNISNVTRIFFFWTWQGKLFFKRDKEKILTRKKFQQRTCAQISQTWQGFFFSTTNMRTNISNVTRKKWQGKKLTRKFVRMFVVDFFFPCHVWDIWFQSWDQNDAL